MTIVLYVTAQCNESWKTSATQGYFGNPLKRDLSHQLPCAPLTACVVTNMACSMEPSTVAGNGRSREDRNCLPSPKGPLYVEDLFLQSDTEVTPMTDIEDSSDDEVYNEEYLGIQRQSVHDAVKNSPDFIHFSNLGTTNRMKHATQDGNRTRCPVVDTAGRDRNSGNDEEELDVLKRVHVHTRSSSPHADSVSRLWPAWIMT